MSNVSMIDGHIDEPKKITRFEKIKRDLTIEQVAKYLEDHDSRYCFEMCKKKTGNKYKRPHEDKAESPCFACAIEYLSEEVSKGKSNKWTFEKRSIREICNERE